MVEFAAMDHPTGWIIGPGDPLDQRVGLNETSSQPQTTLRISLFLPEVKVTTNEWLGLRAFHVDVVGF